MAPTQKICEILKKCSVECYILICNVVLNILSIPTPWSQIVNTLIQLKGDKNQITTLLH